ncbi:unnamed protein product [Protopolystoma xenopodis]|uniref:Uncharacterized protein n=1 Tax=Protopolystoma xenopodis TaxID=117903 RepID=A0A3S5AWT0_9PLAT|nr:unnamed protein product [Protopolystoma xenopodis]
MILQLSGVVTLQSAGTGPGQPVEANWLEEEGACRACSGRPVVFIGPSVARSECGPFSGQLEVAEAREHPSSSCLPHMICTVGLWPGWQHTSKPQACLCGGVYSLDRRFTPGSDRTQASRQPTRLHDFGRIEGASLCPLGDYFRRPLR